RLFIQSIEQGGSLIYYDDDLALHSLAAEANGRKIPYSVHPFELDKNQTIVTDSVGTNYPLAIFGKHNLANLNAAYYVCKEMGVDETTFYNAISSFKGASRRLELVASNGKSFIYRDFAHAPSKVMASTAALRVQHQNDQLIVCLELHTFSSLNEAFIDQYADSLNDADIAIVFYDPHAVALKRLPKMSFDRIKTAFNRKDLMVFSDKENLVSYIIEHYDGSAAIAFMSSGSFNGLNLTEFASNLQIN
ncbi:MAG: peptidoglycan synthetase, partial [Ignavibacteria bacterium]|nr:peptidoglycan synthetase [Ignavibacteria bacterium]